MKIRLVASMASFRTAQHVTGDIAKMWLSLCDDDIDLKGGFSYSMMSPYLFEVYSRVRVWFAPFVASSYNLTVLIDGTSDLKERAPVAIHLFGNFDHITWNYPVSIVEPIDHTAETQLHILQELIDEINKINFEAKHPVPELTLLDFETIVYDTTSSNTGKHKGLGALLDYERKKVWEKSFQEWPFRPLRRIGCQDHVLNLVSEDFEKFLVAHGETKPGLIF